jgi:hypothetical protein
MTPAVGDFFRVPHGEASRRAGYRRSARPVRVRPIGVFKMEDNAGGDEKIIAVPMPKLTKRYAHVMNYTDLPEITLAQIQHFFAHYKDLEPGKWVKVIGWGDAEEARRGCFQRDQKGRISANKMLFDLKNGMLRQVLADLGDNWLFPSSWKPCRKFASVCGGATTTIARALRSCTSHCRCNEFDKTMLFELLPVGRRNHD